MQPSDRLSGLKIDMYENGVATSHVHLGAVATTADFEAVEQFTGNSRQAHELFGSATLRRRLQRQPEQRDLGLLPVVARSLFTVHETLPARRPEGSSNA